MLGYMELRHSAMPDGYESGAEPEETTAEPTQVSFRVDRRLTALRVGGAVVFAVAALFAPDPAAMVFAIGAAVVLGVYAVRDLVAPVRLAADTDGVTVVTGFARRHRLAWSEIDRLRLDERRRLGTRSELVEIDADEQLYLFSTYDLGTRCDEAVTALARLHTAAGSR